MAQSLLVLRGIPNDKRDARAQEWVKSGTPRVELNFDNVSRAVLATGADSLLDEQVETLNTVLLSSAKALLESGQSVVLNGLNLKAKFLRPFLDLAFSLNVEVEHEDLFEGLDSLVRKNPEREALYRDQWKRYVVNGKKYGDFPQAKLASAPQAERYVPVSGTPDAFIVDIDGTLAKMNGRFAHDLRRVGEDLPNQPMIDLVQRLRNTGTKILITSGRDEVCREDTVEWLKRYGVEYDLLLMRKLGDQREDSFVKLDLFNEHIRNDYNVLGVFDDRDQVVSLWRGRTDIESVTPTNGLGLFVCQVDYGNF